MEIRHILAALLTVACSAEAPPPPPSPAELAEAEARLRPIAVPPDPDIADRPFAAPLSIADAESILAATGVFDMAARGFRVGRQVEAFNVVLDQPDAVERFRRLAREARVAGQVYALCGLLLVARPEGVGLAHSLSLKEATLIVRQGGFTFETPLVRGIVLVFANELPEHFRDRRDDAYQ